MVAEFRVLGDVEVLIDGQRIDPGPARRRCVLAALRSPKPIFESQLWT